MTLLLCNAAAMEVTTGYLSFSTTLGCLLLNFAKRKIKKNGGPKADEGEGGRVTLKFGELRNFIYTIYIEV